MNTTTDATAIFAPIWRRKWLILLVAVLVAGGTYLYYKRQPTLFQSTTELYLGAGSEELLSEKSISSKTASIDASTQPAIINSIVLETARKDLRKQHKHLAKVAATGKMRAKSAEKSQFVTITTEAHLSRAAALLANTVAQVYIKRQHAQYEHNVQQSIAIARRQLRKIEAAVAPTASKGKSSKSVSGVSSANVIRDAQLSTKINQLEALLGVTAVQQVKPAKPGGAELLAPKPKSSAIFGFVIGLVLAAIAAFALSRFDRRLRSLGDVTAVLQTQVLTALPEVKRPIIHRDGEPVPSKPLLEPLRRLHTTLQLGGVVDHQRQVSPRSILFLSADAGDGKSTVVANLALVQREAGERTAVIEADFRRPVQAKLLGVSGPQGLAEVLTGQLALGEGMQRVASLAGESLGAEARPGDGLATAVAPAEVGSVSVLVGAAAAANPPALIASEAMSYVIRSLAEDHDRVLIDAPPPLEVSDALPLLAAVDGIILVVRMGHTREASAQRLRELLDRTPAAPVIGVVANGVARKDIEKYGSAGRAWPARLFGR
jgi:Mrp family chromosome partitioning ATPase/capsular polysaccharide biosynthesis protein